MEGLVLAVQSSIRVIGFWNLNLLSLVRRGSRLVAVPRHPPYNTVNCVVKRLEKPRIYSFFLKKKKSLIRPNPGNSYKHI
jgi:hypothetical protein